MVDPRGVNVMTVFHRIEQCIGDATSYYLLLKV